MAQATEFQDFEVQVDFTDIPEMDGSFQLLPAGEYDFEIVHVEQKPSSNNNPMVVVTFQVISEGPQNGQRAWGNYSLLPQSLGRLKKLMVATGANLGAFRASELMGAHLHATVVHNQGEAKIGQDGNPLPVKTFANIQNEVPIETAAPEAKAPAATPPVAKEKAAAAAQPKPTPTPTPNGAKPAGAPRRA